MLQMGIVAVCPVCMAKRFAAQISQLVLTPFSLDRGASWTSFGSRFD